MDMPTPQLMPPAHDDAATMRFFLLEQTRFRKMPIFGARLPH